MPGMGLKRAEEILRHAVALCLEMDPDSKAAQSVIRKSWPTSTEGGMLPEWERLDDFCFLRLFEDIADEYGLRKDITYRFDESTGVFYRIQGETVVWQAMLVFTGPDAQQNAASVRDRVFLATAKQFLQRNHLYPVTAVPPALRNPELHQNQWWERCDLVITLYECAVTEMEEAYFSSAPVSIQP